MHIFFSERALVCGWVGLWCSHKSSQYFFFVQKGQRSPQDHVFHPGGFLIVQRLERREKTWGLCWACLDKTQEENMFWWSLIFWEKARRDSDHRHSVETFLERSRKSFISSVSYNLELWSFAQEVGMTLNHQSIGMLRERAQEGRLISCPLPILVLEDKKIF